jgi:DnaJ-class molecular chaperone
VERKTYYMILGVSRTESPSGIRAAYRDRARRLHPDVAGDEATRAFQELSEAYDVLSDPGRRRAYNAQLGAAQLGAAGDAPARETTSILVHPEAIRPSFEALYERFLRNFTGLGVPKSERLEGLNVEVLLTRAEAAAGCTLPVGVPTFHRCPRCGGSGIEWSYPCAACRRSGLIETERLVHVQIPPMARSGEVYEVTLSGLGIHNFQLRLHVFVEA